jgi:hypothetical protein
MDRPPPDPAKLLQAWMEWEHGDVPPGRVMANLKTGGLRELLEEWAATAQLAAAADADSDSSSTADTWKPVV